MDEGTICEYEVPEFVDLDTWLFPCENLATETVVEENGTHYYLCDEHRTSRGAVIDT